MARRKDRGASALILPGYQDAVEIGGGAFASVYRATEIDTGRPVALKILKIDSVHPRLIETFSRETQALAKVSDHPNIVTLYRTLTTPDGRPVLVLELCRESLGQQVRQSGPLRAHEVTRVGIKIAGALETAHRHDFLHRDMKPQNILVTQFDEPALGDFGVAALQASAQATAGVFGFTTLHAAPEMLEGHHLSPATDVYGLASTMYQLLTGLAPFAAFDNEAPASVILRIIRDPVRPLRSDGHPPRPGGSARGGPLQGSRGAPALGGRVRRRPGGRGGRHRLGSDFVCGMGPDAVGIAAAAADRPGRDLAASRSPHRTPAAARRPGSPLSPDRP